MALESWIVTAVRRGALRNVVDIASAVVFIALFRDYGDCVERGVFEMRESIV